MRARSGVIATVGTLVVASVSGCGTDDGNREIDPVVQAAEVTLEQRDGIGFALKSTTVSNGQKVEAKGTGLTAVDGKKAEVKTRGSVDGEAFDDEQITLGSALYVRGEDMIDLPPGKQWVKQDITTFGAGSRVISTDFGGNDFTDPIGALDYLLGAGESENLGNETINGVETTRYRAEVDLRKAAEQSGAVAPGQIVDLLGLAGTDTMPVDVWVDSSKRVRREHFTIALERGRTRRDMTLDLVRFDVPLDIKPPPADLTVDADEAQLVLLGF